MTSEPLSRRSPRFRTVPSWRVKGKLTTSPRPTQELHAALWDWAEERELVISRASWPDWVVIDDHGDPMLVQVVASKGRKLKGDQLHLLRLLATYGVPCFTWDAEGGFTRICGDDPDPQPEPPY